MSFELGKRAFAYYNTKIHDWYAPSGEYRIVIGASSRELRLRAAVQIESTAKLPVHYSRIWTVGQLITGREGRAVYLEGPVPQDGAFVSSAGRTAGYRGLPGTDRGDSP